MFLLDVFTLSFLLSLSLSLSVRTHTPPFFQMYGHLLLYKKTDARGNGKWKKMGEKEEEEVRHGENNDTGYIYF